MSSVAFLGPFCAFLSSLTWAVGSVGYSRLARGHSPFAINLGRATVALPIFFAATVISCGGFAPAYAAYAAVTRADLAWLALSIFASYGMGDVLFLWSAGRLGVPAALAIGSTFPILTAVWGAVMEGQLLRAAQAAGLVITVAGVVTVIATSEAGHEASKLRSGKRAGVWLALGAMVLWAFNGVGTARAGQHLSPVVGNTVRMLFAIGMSVVFGRVLTRRSPVALPGRVLRQSIPLFVLEAFGGSLFFMYGLSHSPLAVGATLASLAPVLSVPFAWWMGVERFSPIRTVGICGVMLGIWLLA